MILLIHHKDITSAILSMEEIHDMVDERFNAHKRLWNCYKV